MTTDDFEWVESGFDQWHFIHKTRNIAVAKVYPYNGWHIVINGSAPDEELVVESFDAAKVIATLMAAQQMERFPDVTRYGKRSTNASSKKIPRGVFKAD
jgi:hypothetical protein